MTETVYVKTVTQDNEAQQSVLIMPQLDETDVPAGVLANYPIMFIVTDPTQFNYWTPGDAVTLTLEKQNNT